MYATSYSGNTMGIFNKQLLLATLSVITFFVIANFDYRILAKNSKWLYIILLILLVFLLVFGRAIRGSARWIDLGFFNLQPAELAKFVIILGLSRWFYLQRGQINSIKSLLISAVYAFLPAGLILVEPDLGSSLVVSGIWFGILLVSQVKKKYIMAFVLLFVLLSGLAWQFFLHDYQRTRIEVFLDPSLDTTGKGYNVRQAIIAVGSGSMFGSGFGQGLQSQLRFLPERHTDFMFATIAEQVGFAGSLFLIALFIAMCYRILYIMKNAKDRLAYFISAGAFWFFFIQFVINIGMNIGVLPVTGIPLPMISYGGSSLLVSGAVLGLVQNIAAQSKQLRF